MDHYNSIILAGLRRMAAAIPGAPVRDILSDVLAGLRFPPRRVGYQAYLGVLKQQPHCLGVGLDVQGMDKAADL